MEIISSYETLFIVDVEQGDDAVKALVVKFTGLIAANGTIEAVSEWGKRKLAYPINDKNEGLLRSRTSSRAHRASRSSLSVSSVLPMALCVLSSSSVARRSSRRRRLRQQRPPQPLPLRLPRTLNNRSD